MKKQLKAVLPTGEQVGVKKPTFIMSMAVKVGRKSGLHLEVDVKGEVMFLPLSPEGARKIAADLIKAALVIDPMPGLEPSKKTILVELLGWVTKGQYH